MKNTTLGNLEQLLKTPSGCFAIGRDFTDEDFEPIAETVARKVAENHVMCYNAGYHWSPRKFEPVAEVIVKGIIQHPKQSFYAGRDWAEDVFGPFKKTIVRAVAEDYELIPAVFKEWAKVRADYFKQEKERLYLEDPIFMKANEVNESDIKQWFELGRKCDHAQLANLPLQDFYKAAKILEYSQRCGKEEMFFDSFKVVLERGHVREWAQHIIDYHTVKAIGGDTYREVAV